MTPRRIALFLSSVILLIVTSCSKGDKSGLYVPKDAAMVFHINSASLTSKLSWTEITQTEWFKRANKETSDTLALKILNDPAASGIDLKSDFVLYLKKQGRGGFVAFTGSIKDPSAFETFNVKVSEGGSVTKDGDYSQLQFGEDGPLLTWNKSSFVYIVNTPMPDMSSAMMRQGSSYNDYKFSPDSLKIFGKNALNIKSDDNLDTDSRFTELVKDGSDMHVWVNTEKLYGNSFGGMMSMMKFNTILEGNIGTASINFENGKIAMTGRQYYGKELAKLFADYPSKTISTEAINRLPSQNVVGLLAFNYPPEGLKEFVKVIGVDGVVNGFLGRVGYSIDEFVKANKGDLLLSVYDFEIKTAQKSIDIPGQKPYTYSTTEPDMKVLFATSVNDQAAFNKLITIASEQMKDMPQGKFPEITYKLENNWFAASNSAEGVDKFLSSSNGKNPLADKLGGHSSAFFVDLQKIIQSAGAAVTDSSGKAGLTATANMWQDIIGTGDIKDKVGVYKFEINLVDKNTNSLKQLNQYFETLYKINHEKEQKRAAMYSPAMDSVVVSIDTATSTHVK